MTSDPRATQFTGTDRFHPIAFVGHGSMGAVYRVHDEELGCSVALKTLRDLSPEQVYRLKSEFRAIAGVTHPNLVQLHELVVTDTSCFFTMQFVDGVDFVQYVRRTDDPGAIVQRFMAVAPQLVRGVAALHAVGRLHRDVKPSNIRVTAEGQVVLLDFDLATTLSGQTGVASFASAAAGTFAYMAPEQAWGGTLTPAADLYAVGVVFFEALTGRLPFDGAAAELLMAKESLVARRARTLLPAIPDAMDALIAALLSARPADRPDAAAVLAQLGDSEQPETAAPRATPFVGRANELAVLERLYAAARRGDGSVVHLWGPSGIGKSELIRHFLAAVESDAAAWVLRGRCHPEEAVPYRAFDSLIDGLSRKLLGAADALVAELVPPQAWALTRLFPVLGRVPAFAAGEEAAPGAEPYEVRRRGFGALRAMLGQIARRGPLVLWIDDLQWGDADSSALLREILRPPLPALLILSYRDAERGVVANLLAGAHGDEPRQRSLVHEMPIGPLSADESTTLARLLCAETAAARVADVAAESDGSPFFVGQLARHVSAQTAAGGVPTALRLATAVNDRVKALSPVARELLEIVSVAGRPLDRQMVLAAAGASPSQRPLLLNLEHGHLIRSTGLGAAAAVEVYHDRIRETIIANLAAPDLRDRHRRLAGVFMAQSDPDPEALFRHFLGADEKDRAAEWAVHAGDRSDRALAFSEAAELYGRALELRTWSDAEAAAVSVKRADALINAGRGADAAPLLLDVAQKVPADLALEHRRRAGEQYLVSGRTDDGIAILRPLLQEIGLRYPRTPGAAMRGTIVRLLQLRLRGARFRPRSAADIPARQLREVDLCHSAARGLVSVDTVRGGYLALVGLLRALAAGEPVRVGRSLVFAVGAVLAPAGGPLTAWGMRLLEVARRIALQTDDPYLRGGLAVTRGQAALFAGDWPAALAQNDEGLSRLRESCRGVSWECNFARSGALRALEELGQLREFSQRAAEMATISAELGDSYAEMTAALYVGIAKIAAGDIAAAREQLRRVLAKWSQQGFLLQHLYALRVEAHGDLYENAVERAYARVRETWPAIERAFFLRVSVTRIDAYLLRARVTLAAANRVPQQRAEYLQRCAQDARRLRRERRQDTAGHAATIEAGIAAARGDTGAAIRLLDQAIHAYERMGMHAHRACAVRRKGELVGGDDGTALTASADAALRDAGVAEPSRWTAIIAPGFQ